VAFNPERVLNEVADALERQTETLEKAVDKATYQLRSEEQPKWAQEVNFTKKQLDKLTLSDLCAYLHCLI
jgi:hypothetical protein